MKTARIIVKGDIIFYAFISICYYCLIRQYVKCSDDAFYTYIHPEGKIIISSLSDIIKSQSWDYLNHNGRVVVHSLVQYLCGKTFGSELYFALSTFFFIILISGIVFHIRSQYSKSAYDKYLVAILLFFFIPYFGMVFIGQISFTANYMWSSAILIWFYNIYNYFRLADSKFLTKKTALLPALFFFGFIFGSWQESFTIPVAGTLTIYYIFNYKRILHTNKFVVLLLLGFCVGFLFEVLAPANFARFTKSKPGGVAINLEVLKVIFDSARLITLIIIVALGVFCLNNNNRLIFLKKNWFFIGIIALSFLFAILIQFNDHRQFVACVLCMILLVTKLVYEFDFIWDEHYNTFRFFVAITSIITISVLGATYMVRSEITEQWKQYLPSDKNVVHVGAPNLYKTLTKYDANNFFYYYTEFGFLPPSVNTLLPEDINNIVEVGQNIENSLYEIEGTDCYILKAQKDIPWKESTFTVSTRVSILGHLKRWLLGNHVKSKETIIGIPENCSVFEDENYRYVVMYFPHSDFPSVKLQSIK